MLKVINETKHKSIKPNPKVASPSGAPAFFGRAAKGLI